MNDPRIFENPCAICKVRVAEKLCDYVIRYDNSIIFYRNLQRFIRENSRCRHETCDLPLCNKCAIEIGVNVDFCPHHYKLQRNYAIETKCVVRKGNYNGIVRFSN